MNNYTSLPRSAKVRAHARLRVHCPPCYTNHWDRLPSHLQTHIKELAAEAFSRQQMRKVHVQLLERACDQKRLVADDALAAFNTARNRSEAMEAAVTAQETVNSMLEQHGYQPHLLPLSMALEAENHALREEIQALTASREAEYELITTLRQKRWATIAAL